MYVHPSASQLATLAAIDSDEPVVMLNLLRFVDQAKPGNGCDAMTGREAFDEYGRRLREMDFAGRPFWFGEAGPTVIGPDDEEWDLVILVRYESARAFLHAVSTDEYQEASRARDAAVADSRLVLVTDGSA